MDSNPEMPSMAEAAPKEKPLNFMGRLIGIFASPIKTLADIAARELSFLDSISIWATASRLNALESEGVAMTNGVGWYCDAKGAEAANAGLELLGEEETGRVETVCGG